FLLRAVRALLALLLLLGEVGVVDALGLDVVRLGERRLAVLVLGFAPVHVLLGVAHVPLQVRAIRLEVLHARGGSLLGVFRLAQIALRVVHAIHVSRLLGALLRRD